MTENLSWDKEFEDLDITEDNDGETPYGIINANELRLEDCFMEVQTAAQQQLWWSNWEHKHPDCEREAWALRIYHSTSDDQLLALYCMNCGKPVDPAELINALILRLEDLSEGSDDMGS